ncbi:capsular exopolysaccharide synthesis family protein [Agromyces ramosus]|uniref:Capsular exopolysaccharide synthesis family protein n=1 Tax=Agromyces ramosus TaxID=33879 RepID=A0A4Q7M6Y2_9MICO|nr:polysaccharide biosynthesis tyrosine autokinase [Agromyces ramosus]RZS63474.1 capsular exopolysaccharide synthesis family protein [Agromyces ramosus]
MELRDYMRGLRRHWLAIVLMTAIGLGAGYGWTLLQTPVYTANASGYVASKQSEDVGISTIGDNLARSRVQSYLDIAGWRAVAENAIEELGLDTTPEDLVTRVTVENPEDTVIMKISAEASTPTDARDLAEAWLRGMIIEIDAIEGDGTEGSAPVTVITGDSASLPSSPSFPDVQSAVLVGGILGLGFGIAFAMIRTVSDRRIRSADDVEQKTGVAVVGTIPIVPGLDAENRLIDASEKPSGKVSHFAVSEALRSLRTNLQFMDVDHPPKTIVVTSPLPGDGKSTIACNLALTLAAAGTTVVLVDGDLRRSMVAKTMGLPGGAGLSDVLAGRASLAEVLQRTPRSNNLLVLAAGSVPPNPSEVLGSERMHTLLSDLTKHATVIIDAPPLLPVTDGAVLTHQADGALVVVTLGKTTHDLLEKALDTLRKARGRALGVVLNKTPLRGADASPYSYDYRRDYTATVPEDAPVPHTDIGADLSAELPDLDSEHEPVPAPARRGRRS